MGVHRGSKLLLDFKKFVFEGLSDLQGAFGLDEEIVCKKEHVQSDHSKSLSQARVAQLGACQLAVTKSDFKPHPGEISINKFS